MSMGQTDAVLSLNNLRAGYGQTEILHDLSIYVNPNEIVAIIGPNGAGKSTAMKAVLGLLNITEGSVVLNGEDITDTPAQKVIERGISYVPQTNNVFVNLSVQENLEMGAWTRPTGVEARLDEMYDLFPDLAEKRNQAAGSLSGGQRQMVAMAKALMVDAKILLLDEPTAGLSPKYRGEIFATIQKIKGTGVPILIVEQNAKQALGVSDRGYVLVDGANRHTGTGAGLAADPEIARMFLGGGH
ncbi:MAG: ABC transporter ATP-binding protein [Octadecabacter sp.]|jgi:branched-chain amino acid transport system ATP-binding protein|uniref:Branched chain amino acid ABC transporter ATP-binding protein n=1 Tax=Octadecabacter arcticus 238 TaxID=391616 RepID=M9RIQ1_9RHOB|nr:ABC transporter ATP-binding protein [Octadecabacter arcticus]AGI72057.1 branched chain amino acid ABC transporter ATP-binding protein [Octadecabacter arcticus 238]